LKNDSIEYAATTHNVVVVFMRIVARRAVGAVVSMINVVLAVA
jgi:hypothetical protein